MRLDAKAARGCGLDLRQRVCNRVDWRRTRPLVLMAGTERCGRSFDAMLAVRRVDPASVASEVWKERGKSFGNRLIPSVRKH